jgi:isoleucyl-tRNA synthetase
MPAYKDTLNLPKTAFSMKANLAQKEPLRLKKWMEENAYQRIRKHFANADKFILHDGPPYANGDIHIGHAVNKILKDIVIRSKTLSGFDAPYIPGWDCHGLPIELQVEKKIGKAGDKVSANEFRKACRKYAASQVKRQAKDFQRLGILGDWDHPYLTMDFKYEANIIRTLAKIIDNGHLVKGAKPVHWCTDCGSALAEAEVEYQDKDSFAIDVKFSIDSEAVSQAFNVDQLSHPTSAIIWTTTPWTLPANEAIAVHNDTLYALVNIGSNNIIVAEPLLEPLMNKIDITNYQILATTQGAQLTQLTAKHPFYDKIVPIVHGEHVTIDSGTGLVHTAPAHGIEDFELGKKYDLPLNNPVNNHGCYHDDIPYFAKMFVFSANQPIIDLLIKNNALLHSTNLTHSYPHCWRHKKPLIFRATPQWFISMSQNSLQSEATKAIDKIQWIPLWGKNRISSMIENRPDWCISRQRTWGVPIPLFIHKNTGQLHPNTTEIMEKVAKIVEKNGIEAWFDSNDSAFIKEIDHYERVHDILDVWFDSGASNACVLETNKALGFPADLYLEGSDQHRGWFQTSLLTSLARCNHIPAYQVLTHGFTVDAEGKKMSKSLGNVISPQAVVNNLGADVLRLWVAATDYQSEMNVSEAILKRTTDIYRRIRNTARFLLSNLQDFNPTTDIMDFSTLVAIDQWAIVQAKTVQTDIIDAYHHYNFHLVIQHIHHFCSIEMGSFYLDVIKDRQYTTSSMGSARKSAQTAMYHILQALVRWISPILCFTADEIWEAMPFKNNQQLILCQWYDHINHFALSHPFTLDFWHSIQQVKGECNKLIEAKRTKGEIGGSLEVEITLYVDKALYEKLLPLAAELHFALIVSKASIKTCQDKTKSALATAIDGLFIEVVKSPEEKCERCWHRCQSVGKNSEYPDICARCIENITTDTGERREFV